MTDDKELRKGLIRLAYEKPELRETLLPLVSPQKQAQTITLLMMIPVMT